MGKHSAVLLTTLVCTVIPGIASLSVRHSTAISPNSPVWLSLRDFCKFALIPICIGKWDQGPNTSKASITFYITRPALCPKVGDQEQYAYWATSNPAYFSSDSLLCSSLRKLYSVSGTVKLGLDWSYVFLGYIILCLVLAFLDSKSRTCLPCCFCSVTPSQRRLSPEYSYCLLLLERGKAIRSTKKQKEFLHQNILQYMQFILVVLLSF